MYYVLRTMNEFGQEFYVHEKPIESYPSAEYERIHVWDSDFTLARFFISFSEALAFLDNEFETSALAVTFAVEDVEIMVVELRHVEEVRKEPTHAPANETSGGSIFKSSPSRETETASKDREMTLTEAARDLDRKIRDAYLFQERFVAINSVTAGPVNQIPRLQILLTRAPIGGDVEKLRAISPWKGFPIEFEVIGTPNPVRAHKERK